MPVNDAIRQQEQLYRAINERVVRLHEYISSTQDKLKKAIQNVELEEAKLQSMVAEAAAFDSKRILNQRTSVTVSRSSTSSPEKEFFRAVNSIGSPLKSLKSKEARTKRGSTFLFGGIIIIGCLFMLILSFNGFSQPDSGMWIFAFTCIVPPGIVALIGLLMLVLGGGQLEQIRQHRNEAMFWAQEWKSDLQKQAQYYVGQTMGNTAADLVQYAPQIEDLREDLYPISLEWDNNYWNNWKPSTSFPQVMNLGNIRIPLVMDTIAFPAFFSFPEDSNYLILADPESKKIISDGIQSLLLRIIANLPPGKVRFTFIDPVGLGQNFSSFTHLADYDEALINGKVWSEQQQIEKKLSDLTEHLENVIQKYLRNKFENIDEFNKQAGEIAEPYRFLVVFDFPVNFSDTAARHLLSIAQNGKRCGVYTIIVADPNRELPYGFNPQELEKTCNIITSEDGVLTWHDPSFELHQLVLDKLPDSKIVNRILAGVGELAKETSRVEVPFDKMFGIFRNQVTKFASEFPSIRATFDPAHSSTWWQASAENEIVIPLGRSGAEKIQCLRLGKSTAQHGLVAGKTGSGKSTLFHVMITTLSMMYSPDELEVYLVDFKKGVEFKLFASNRLPHARVIAIESEREFGLSVLQGLDRKVQERGETFKQLAQDKQEQVDNISDYRKKSGKIMPRILLLVDEFQEFFTTDDRIASQSAQILDRLVRLGRAFGIHVLLGSQTLSGAYTLARSTMDQMAVRIALQCSEADSRLILSDDNPAARLLSRPGEAIYNSANGLVEGNSSFQISWLKEDEQKKYLETIYKYSLEKGYKPSSPPIIFEGNALSVIEKNPFLNNLYRSNFWAQEGLKYFAWLGDPVEIRDPVVVAFRRQSGSNMMILGQQEERAAGMMLGKMLSLAPQIRPSQAPRIIFADFRPPDSPVSGSLAKFSQVFAYPVKYVRNREFTPLLAQIAKETNRRVEANTSSAPAIFVFLFGLQHARDLRKEDGFGYSGDAQETNPAQHFANVLRDGPDVGVFVCSWCDTYQNMARALDRQSQREFGLRVAFQMNSDDASSFMDSNDAGKLGANRALFLDEISGSVQKVIPYNYPGGEWFRWANDILRNRLAGDK
jgi:hypothetical protein